MRKVLGWKNLIWFGFVQLNENVSLFILQTKKRFSKLLATTFENHCSRSFSQSWHKKLKKMRLFRICCTQFKQTLRYLTLYSHIMWLVDIWNCVVCAWSVLMICIILVVNLKTALLTYMSYVSFNTFSCISFQFKEFLLDIHDIMYVFVLYSPLLNGGNSDYIFHESNQLKLHFNLIISDKCWIQSQKRGNTNLAYSKSTNTGQ